MLGFLCLRINRSVCARLSCIRLSKAGGHDQPQAMTEAEVSEGLGLDTLKGRQWAIYKSCAIKGEGLETGLDWCAHCSIRFVTKLMLYVSAQAGTIVRHKVTSCAAVYMHLVFASASLN